MFLSFVGLALDILCQAYSGEVYVISVVYFGFKRYESVKLLQFYCKELPFEYIVDSYKWKFLTSRAYVSDRFTFFYEYNVHVVNEFYSKYALSGSSLSSSNMKCAVMDYFNTFCIEQVVTADCLMFLCVYDWCFPLLTMCKACDCCSFTCFTVFFTFFLCSLPA